MKLAGLELRKWNFNDRSVINYDKEERETGRNFTDTANITCLGDSLSKILGLHWNSDSDTFNYKIRDYSEEHVVTKHQILSDISTIFDPLGLLGSVIIQAKCIIQNL
jgi:hypothetical protein